MHPADRPDRSTREGRRFPWGLWALLGVIGWIVAMVILGTPIYILLAPAAGVILGWVAGGIVFLLAGAVGSLRPRR
jgi:hypothetical protein